jgi:FixJ family two-component response regulator
MTSGLVVFVDDEGQVKEYLVAVLERQGYRHAPFTDPGSALDFARQHSREIRLVIADIRMPDISPDPPSGCVRRHPTMPEIRSRIGLISARN